MGQGERERERERERAPPKRHRTLPNNPPVWGSRRDALEGGAGGRAQRRFQKRLDRRLEGVAEAVGGGYCRLQMPLRQGLGVRETVAGHRLGGLEVGGGDTTPPSNASLRSRLPYWIGKCLQPTTDVDGPGFGKKWTPSPFVPEACSRPPTAVLGVWCFGASFGCGSAL